MSAVVAIGLLLPLAGCSTAGGPPGAPQVSSIAAMGDSITRAFDACTFLQDCLAKSWATGSDPAVASHYRRLSARNPGVAGRAFNAAQVGATSANVPAQAAAVAARRPDYVTLLIGANDACAANLASMTSRSVFRARIDQALTTIYSARPGTRMLVVSIPNLYRLWQVGHSNSTARLVWSAGFCHTMLDNPLSTATADKTRRARVLAQVVMYNGELAAACRSHPGCRFDDNAVFNYPFAISDMSQFDYFHPNAKGQKILSAVTWGKSGL
jgi:lysophospholipase L1-like esterase